MDAAGAAVFLVLLSSACNEPPRDPPPLGEEMRDRLSSWIDENGADPVEYVIRLFDDHDVVFLGEQHRARHDPLLVQSLVAPLRRAGVRILATEFGRREDQPLVDSLLAQSSWNEDLAREIVFRQNVWWGYREYVDLYRAAWDVNRTLAGGEPPFRILGINDSPDWSFVRKDADRNDPEVMRRVWRGGDEEKWAGVILDAVDAGKKVLVYCGIHHAFTGYRQPIVANGKFVRFDPNLRCGNHVFNAIGKRVVTIFLHAPWRGSDGYGSPMVHPADGVIDALMLENPRPVGFDVAGGPFGELKVRNAVYRHGYDDFRLADFCDGWIYTKPISEYEGVAPIAGWVNGSNLERARAQSPNPSFRKASAEEFNRGLTRDADISRRWGRLR